MPLETYIKTPIDISPFPNAILQTIREIKYPLWLKWCPRVLMPLGSFVTLGFYRQQCFGK
jgi:hypothetical protein